MRYAELYDHLCMHKLPYTFVTCDCIVCRLYAKLLSTYVPNLAYCATFLVKACKLMSQCMGFPSMWYVRPAKSQTSLGIRAD